MILSSSGTDTPPLAGGHSDSASSGPRSQSVMTAAKNSLFRRLFIFNPLLSCGKEERAEDNIIFYHPSSDNLNTQMNRVGFSVACACTVERFAVRSGEQELVTEIRTSQSVLTLLSPVENLWIVLEAGNALASTAAVRLLLERALVAFRVLYGSCSLEIVPPPGKRYVPGANPAYDAALANNAAHKANFSRFFGQLADYLAAFALPAAADGAGPRGDFRLRTAADALLGLPTHIATQSSGVHLQVQSAVTAFTALATLSDEEIRHRLVVHTPTAAADSIASPVPVLAVVLCAVDDGRLLFSSAAEDTTQALLFLARTQLRTLDEANTVPLLLHGPQKLDGKGGPAAATFVRRAGFSAFVVAAPGDTAGAVAIELLCRRRRYLVLDLLHAAEAICRGPVAAHESRARMKGRTEPALRVLFHSSATAHLLSACRGSVETCLGEPTTKHSVHSSYPAGLPQPVAAPSVVHPTMICANRGFVYGAPLAALPWAVQIVVAAVLHSLSGRAYFVQPIAREAFTRRPACDALIDSLDFRRCNGRMTNTATAGQLEPLSPSAIAADSFADVAELWTAVSVGPSTDPAQTASAGAADSAVPKKTRPTALQTIAAAAQNGRVVVLVYPPKALRGSSAPADVVTVDQMVSARAIFKAAFPSSGNFI